MTEQIRPSDRVKMVRGRMRESIRLAKRSRNPQQPQVIAYFRYLFTDTKKFISEVGFSCFNSVFRPSELKSSILFLHMLEGHLRCNKCC